eukprot:1693045-Pleurochrysis_carterae.AAC.1
MPEEELLLKFANWTLANVGLSYSGVPNSETRISHAQHTPNPLLRCHPPVPASLAFRSLVATPPRLSNDFLHLIAASQMRALRARAR